MSASEAGLEAFLAWETEACKVQEKHFPIRQLREDLTVEWNRKRDKKQYLEALEAVRHSLKDAESCRNEISRAAKHRRGSNPSALEGRRNLQKALVKALQITHHVTAALLVFSELQLEPADDGAGGVNKLSRLYTAKVLVKAQAGIMQLEQKIEECRKARRELGSPVASAGLARPARVESKDAQTDAQNKLSASNVDAESDLLANLQRNLEEHAKKLKTQGGRSTEPPKKRRRDAGRVANGQAQPQTGDAAQGRGRKRSIGSVSSPESKSSPEQSNAEAGKRPRHRIRLKRSPPSKTNDPNAIPNKEQVSPGARGSGFPQADEKQASQSALAGAADDGPRNASLTAEQRMQINEVLSRVKQDPAFKHYVGRALEDAKNDPPISKDAMLLLVHALLKDGVTDWDNERLPRSRMRGSPSGMPPSQNGVRGDVQAGKPSNGLQAAWDAFITKLVDRNTSEVEVGTYLNLMKRALAVQREGGDSIEPPILRITTRTHGMYQHLEEQIRHAENALRAQRDQERLERLADSRDKIGTAKRLGPGDARNQRVVRGDFVYMDSIGSGGQGHAGLWVEFDEYGRLVRRVVLKETYLETDMSRQWDDEWPWHGKVGDRYPLEAKIHRDATNIDTEASCIVHFLAYAVYEKQRMYRTYCEYCPHGDVYNLLEEHQKLKRSYRAYGKPKNHHIPTSALWAIFEALAKAAYILHNGGVPGQLDVPGWDVILHRDIKPHNIFLSHPNEEIWRSIPQAKLGDFGLAVLEANPNSQVLGPGTPEYMAPEQVQYYDRYGRPLPPHRHISSAVDIWAIGMTMLELMNGGIYQKPFDYTAGSQRPSFTPEAFEIYSEDLKMLIMQCLHPDQDRRIDANTLWHSIQEAVTKLGRDDQNVPLKYSSLKRDEVLRFKPDKYTAWMN